MRMVIACTSLAFFASAALGQAPAEQDRVLRLTHFGIPQDLSEIAMLIRTMAEIREISADPGQGAISLHTTPAKIDLAEWLLNELTQPPDEAKHEYRPARSSDDIVRVFFLKHAEQVRDLNEVAVMARTIGGIPKLFAYGPPRALAVRGTEEQIGLTEWLIGKLDLPASPHDAGIHEYSRLSGVDNVVRVFYLPDSTPIPRLNEISVQIRRAAEIRKLFANPRARAIIVRGTASQIATAEQMLKP